MHLHLLSSVQQNIMHILSMGHRKEKMLADLHFGSSVTFKAKLGTEEIGWDFIYAPNEMYRPIQFSLFLILHVIGMMAP